MTAPSRPGDLQWRVAVPPDPTAPTAAPTVGSRVTVSNRADRRRIDCWFENPQLTEVLCDPDWTSPPPSHTNLPPGQWVTITAELGHPAWVEPTVPGPWFLAEFSAAQYTWQTALSLADMVG